MLKLPCALAAILLFVPGNTETPYASPLLPLSFRPMLLMQKGVKCVWCPRNSERHRFPGLVAVGRIEAWRTLGGATRHHVRHVLLSRHLAPAELLAVVREHWTIENASHWPLDVVLDEDLARARKDHAPKNLALLRRLTLNVLRAQPGKQSLNLKRQRPGWDESFLLELFTHMR